METLQGRVGYTGRLAPCRWGVGKVVCDCVRSGHRCSPSCTAMHALCIVACCICLIII